MRLADLKKKLNRYSLSYIILVSIIIHRLPTFFVFLTITYRTYSLVGNIYSVLQENSVLAQAINSIPSFTSLSLDFHSFVLSLPISLRSLDGDLFLNACKWDATLCGYSLKYHVLLRLCEWMSGRKAEQEGQIANKKSQWTIEREREKEKGRKTKFRERRKTRLAVSVLSGYIGDARRDARYVGNASREM